MVKKILQRCSLCKNFHASYLVEDPHTGERKILCYNCWRKQFEHKGPNPAVTETGDPKDAKPPPEI